MPFIVLDEACLDTFVFIIVLFYSLINGYVGGFYHIPRVLVRKYCLKQWVCSLYPTWKRWLYDTLLYLWLRRTNIILKILFFLRLICPTVWRTLKWWNYIWFCIDCIVTEHYFGHENDNFEKSSLKGIIQIILFKEYICVNGSLFLLQLFLRDCSKAK